MTGHWIAFLLLSLMLGGAIPHCNEEAPESSRDQESDAGVLVLTTEMHVARAAHTATPLPDGRVLVVGGFSAEEDAAQGPELYNPDMPGFSAANAMQTPRHSHTATLLPDGQILIAGGFDMQTRPLTDAELYDPATDTFAPTGSLVNARTDHVAVLLLDGRVLLAGGVGPGWSFLTDAELYDPATGTFAPTGSMTVPRESHTAVRLQDGRVLVAGGHRGRRADITLYASAEMYDPTSGTFTPVGDMTIRRHKHDAVLLLDGRVLISGGTDERDNEGVYNTTELFDPKTGRFEAGARMNLPRYKHKGTSMLLPDGLVLIAGGAPQAETYDPARGVFTIVGGAARMAGQFSAAAPLPGGRVLVTGGYGQGRGPRATAWLYRP